MAQLSPLRRRMIEDMTVRNMSPATQRSYVSAVSKFSRHFGKSPEQLDLEDVRAFRSISFRRASRGPVSIRSSAPYASSTASRSARPRFPSVSPMRASRANCRLC
jgi:Phage integrase, N-terminal SAM-like domain